MDNDDVALDHLAFADRLPSVPRTRIFGIFGELSSGDIGVSSNSVVGVSGLYRVRACSGCSGFSGRIGKE